MENEDLRPFNISPEVLVCAYVYDALHRLLRLFRKVLLTIFPLSMNIIVI